MKLQRESGLEISESYVIELKEIMIQNPAGRYILEVTLQLHDGQGSHSEGRLTAVGRYHKKGETVWSHQQMKDFNLKNKIGGKFQYDFPYLSSVPKFVLTTPAQA
jgi:hypothetical protein